MKDPRIINMAQVIVNHSLNIQKEENFLIEGEKDSIPLMKEIYRAALKVGANPHTHILVPEISEIFYQEADEEQLKRIHEMEWARKTKFGKRCRILAESNTKAFSQVDPQKEKIATIARKELIEEFNKNTTWNVTIFPTEAYAQQAEMALETWEDFVFSACFCDSQEPVEELNKFNTWQNKVLEKIKGKKEVKIIGEDTDITINIEGRKFCAEDGKINLPPGEIYVSAVEEKVNGHIRFTYPIIFHGREISNIFLRFKDGLVVEWSADKNKDVLESLINTDAGAKRVGELGIGTNVNVNRFTQNLLFDEKIIGTIHLALGNSYTETLGKNKSLIHVDMICDLKNGGEIYADGELFQKNGEFIGVESIK